MASQNIFKPSGERSFLNDLLVNEPISLSRSFCYELEEFVRRNSIFVNKYSIHDRKPVYICCESCLKAFALHLAKEKNLPKEVISYLKKNLKGEIGHEGYFLDNENLIKEA